MLRRRHINADPRGRAARVQLGIAHHARGPVERLAWGVERRLVWPLRERTAGWSPPRHLAGAGALGLVVTAAVVIGVLSLTGNDAGGDRGTTPDRVALAAPPQQPADEPDEPALQGTPPSFGVGAGAAVAERASDDSSGAEAEDSPEEAEASGETVEPEAGAAATTSSKKSVPAGPAAMKTARRFAEAFVFYEIGERPARARTVFGETATPQLAEALAERPPRQPASTEVPQARVVNLVPGPRAGEAYTVSVSMLRVGLTSELRLELEKQAGAWVVTDVRG